MSGPDRTGSDSTTSDPSGPGSARAARDRARIDAVFGETLPATTSDEARGSDGRIHDDWWRDQRPPHHG